MTAAQSSPACPQLAAELRAVQALARQRSQPRVPFVIDGQLAGSVACLHLAALHALEPALRTGLDVGDAGVALHVRAEARDAWFARVNTVLRAQGLIRAWRDEIYGVTAQDSGESLARIERASSRFWGTWTLGAHANGYVADDAGAVEHLWIAQRSPHKATDPGLLDNLVGGGVPHDQSPREALLREAWEEAGLPQPLAATAVEAGVLELDRDIPEGLQRERLHAFDLRLPAGLVPANQDGEVAAFECLDLRALAERRPWRAMTTDAALVTLDFVARRLPALLSARRGG